MVIWSIIFQFFLLTSCSDVRIIGAPLDYSLVLQDNVYVLNNKLNEISGLTYANGKLYAVQDEKGKIYEIDLQQPPVIVENKFWKEGDYEGVEKVGDSFIVMKSNGNLYKVPEDIDEEKTEKIELPFTKVDNFEGLAYDSKNQRLLMASKAEPRHPVKFVYAVDLKTMEAQQEPVMSIGHLDAIEFVKKQQTDGVLGKLSLANYRFNPSGIAIHPKTEEIYVLSHPDQQLMVFSKKGKIKSLAFLSPEKFRQPEGICFDPAGNLYISNEGGSGKANIIKFEYLKS